LRRRILLVDDTLTITALERALLGAGFDYVEARNGIEAHECARSESPDLILMDLNMPVAGGMEGLRRLKNDPSTARIPVVIISTEGDEETVAACHAAGCCEFLGKPIDAERLRSTVGRLLP
jgi:CheY-like chemotaxis protein